MKVNITKSSKEANEDRIELDVVIKKVKICPECGHKNRCPNTYIEKPMVHGDMTDTRHIYNIKNKCTECGCEYEVESGPLPPNLTMYDPE